MRRIETRMPDSDLYMGLAGVAVVFAGFSGISVVLTGRQPEQWRPIDAARVSMMISLSIATAFFSLLPLVVARLVTSSESIWQVCSPLFLVFAVAAPIRGFLRIRSVYRMPEIETQKSVCPPPESNPRESPLFRSRPRCVEGGTETPGARNHKRVSRSGEPDSVQIANGVKTPRRGWEGFARVDPEELGRASSPVDRAWQGCCSSVPFLFLFQWVTSTVTLLRDLR
jgi:hypothetical protein